MLVRQERTTFPLQNQKQKERRYRHSWVEVSAAFQETLPSSIQAKNHRLQEETIKKNNVQFQKNKILTLKDLSLVMKKDGVSLLRTIDDWVGTRFDIRRDMRYCPK